MVATNRMGSGGKGVQIAFTPIGDAVVFNTVHGLTTSFNQLTVSLTKNGQAGLVAFNSLERGVLKLGAAADQTLNRSPMLKALFGAGAGWWISSGMQGMGQAIGRITGAIAKGFWDAGKAAAEFDRKLREIQTIAGQSPAAQRGMRRDILGLAGKYGRDPGQFTEAYYQAYSSVPNLTPQGAKTFVQEATSLSVAGLANIEDSITALSTAMNAWGLGMDQAHRISNIFFQGVDEGIYRVKDLAGAVGRFGASAAALKVPIDDAMAAFSALTLGGLKTRMAAMSVNSMFESILKSADRTKSQMTDAWRVIMGADWTPTKLAQTGGIAALMGQLNAMPEQARETALRGMFTDAAGRRAARMLSGPMYGTFKQNATMFDEGANPTDRVKAAEELILNSSATAYDRAAAATAAFKIALGEVVNTLSPLLVMYAKGATWLAKFIEGHPILMKVLMALGVVVLAIAASFAKGLYEVGRFFNAIWRAVQGIQAEAIALAKAKADLLANASAANTAAQAHHNLAGAMTRSAAAAGGARGGAAAGPPAGSLLGLQAASAAAQQNLAAQQAAAQRQAQTVAGLRGRANEGWWLAPGATGGGPGGPVNLARGRATMAIANRDLNQQAFAELEAAHQKYQGLAAKVAAAEQKAAGGITSSHTTAFLDRIRGQRDEAKQAFDALTATWDQRLSQAQTRHRQALANLQRYEGDLSVAAAQAGAPVPGAAGHRAGVTGRRAQAAQAVLDQARAAVAAAEAEVQAAQAAYRSAIPPMQTQFVGTTSKAAAATSQWGAALTKTAGSLRGVVGVVGGFLSGILSSIGGMLAWGIALAAIETAWRKIAEAIQAAKQAQEDAAAAGKGLKGSQVAPTPGGPSDKEIQSVLGATTPQSRALYDALVRNKGDVAATIQEAEFRPAVYANTPAGAVQQRPAGFTVATSEGGKAFFPESTFRQTLDEFKRNEFAQIDAVIRELESRAPKSVPKWAQAARGQLGGVNEPSIGFDEQVKQLQGSGKLAPDDVTLSDAAITKINQRVDQLKGAYKEVAAVEDALRIPDEANQTDLDARNAGRVNRIQALEGMVERAKAEATMRNEILGAFEARRGAGDTTVTDPMLAGARAEAEKSLVTFRDLLDLYLMIQGAYTDAAQAQGKDAKDYHAMLVATKSLVGEQAKTEKELYEARTNGAKQAAKALKDQAEAQAKAAKEAQQAAEQAKRDQRERQSNTIETIQARIDVAEAEAELLKANKAGPDAQAAKQQEIRALYEQRFAEQLKLAGMEQSALDPTRVEREKLRITQQRLGLSLKEIEAKRDANRADQDFTQRIAEQLNRRALIAKRGLPTFEDYMLGFGAQQSFAAKMGGALQGGAFRSRLGLNWTGSGRQTLGTRLPGEGQFGPVVAGQQQAAMTVFNFQFQGTADPKAVQQWWDTQAKGSLQQLNDQWYRDRQAKDAAGRGRSTPTASWR